MAKLAPYLRTVYEDIVADAEADTTQIVSAEMRTRIDKEAGVVDIYASDTCQYETIDGKVIGVESYERARTMLAQDSAPVQKTEPKPGRCMSPKMAEAVAYAKGLVEQEKCSKNEAAAIAEAKYKGVSYGTIRNHLKAKMA